MPSLRGGSPGLEGVVEAIIIALGIIVGGVLLMFVLGGCAAYPRTLAQAPIDSVVSREVLDWSVEPGPEDELEVRVRVAEMRAALAVADRYEGVVKLQNLAVDQVEVMMVAYDGAAGDVEEATQAGWWNSGLGFLGGVAVGLIIMGFVR